MKIGIAAATLLLGTLLAGPVWAQKTDKTPLITGSTIRMPAAADARDSCRPNALGVARVDEIEKGMSAVRWAAGVPTAPYFRFPGLRHPPELVTYLGQRNVAIFSTDFDSFDFRMKKPDELRKAILAKLKKHGKGIALMHDFQGVTAHAALDLLDDLKAGGYRIVFMKPKGALATIASYDEQVLKDAKLPTIDSRPTSSVVRTISE